MTDAHDVTKPDTAVLIHGLWMTALSWEGWVARDDRTASRLRDELSIPRRRAPRAAARRGSARQIGAGGAWWNH